MQQTALCGLHAQNAQDIDAHAGQHQPGRAEKYEPASLVKARSQGQSKEGAPVIPYSIIVTGDDPELVISGRNIRIERFMLLARGDPVFIEAFQFEFVLGLFRGHKAQSSKLEFHVPAVRWDGCAILQRLAIHTYALDDDRRRQQIFMQLIGIYFNDAPHTGKEQFPFPRFPRAGLYTAIKFSVEQAISNAVGSVRDGLDSLLREVIEIALARTEQAEIGAHP